MKTAWGCLIVVSLSLGSLLGDEAPTVADQFQSVATDYRLLASAISQPELMEAAGRLARDGYRQVIDAAQTQAELSPDDLYALGQCHEALGQFDAARQRYVDSMARAESTRGHLALARLAAAIDPAAAEQHFNNAEKLGAQDPRLPAFHLLLGAAFQRDRNWTKAIDHLNQYQQHVAALAEDAPSAAGLLARRDATALRIKNMETFGALLGAAAPSWDVQVPIQGEVPTLQQLRGQVVVLDCFAVWAESSQARMTALAAFAKQHEGKPVTVIGLGLSVDDGIAAGRQADVENSLSYAQRAGVGWPLAFTSRETLAAYGVSTVPHTVVIDQQGHVRAILQSGTAGDLEALDSAVNELLP